MKWAPVPREWGSDVCHTHVTREKYRSVHKDFSGTVDSISSVTAGKTEIVCAKVKKTTAQKGQMAVTTLMVDGTEETAAADEIRSGPVPSCISLSDTSLSSFSDEDPVGALAVVSSITSIGA